MMLLQRYSGSTDSTQGLMFDCDKFECHTLEDEHRKEKVRGETRIPEGIYEIKLREETTPLTQTYRNKYPWFTYHLELQDVPNFKNIYIHIGNTDDDTEGCIMVQDGAGNNQYGKSFNPDSRPAFERLYKKVRKQLLNGEKVFIDVRDEDRIL